MRLSASTSASLEDLMDSPRDLENSIFNPISSIWNLRKLTFETPLAAKRHSAHHVAREIIPQSVSGASLDAVVALGLVSSPG